MEGQRRGGHRGTQGWAGGRDHGPALNWPLGCLFCSHPVLPTVLAPCAVGPAPGLLWASASLPCCLCVCVLICLGHLLESGVPRGQASTSPWPGAGAGWTSSRRSGAQRVQSKIERLSSRRSGRRDREGGSSCHTCGSLTSCCLPAPLGGSVRELPFSASVCLWDPAPEGRVEGVSGTEDVGRPLLSRAPFPRRVSRLLQSPTTRVGPTWTLLRCGGTTGSSSAGWPGSWRRSPWGSEARPRARAHTAPGRGPAVSAARTVTVTLRAGTKKGELAEPQHVLFPYLSRSGQASLLTLCCMWDDDSRTQCPVLPAWRSAEVVTAVPTPLPAGVHTCRLWLPVCRIGGGDEPVMVLRGNGASQPERRPAGGLCGPGRGRHLVAVLHSPSCLFPYNLVTSFLFVVCYKLSHLEILSGNKYFLKTRIDEKWGASKRFTAGCEDGRCLPGRASICVLADLRVLRAGTRGPV